MKNVSGTAVLCRASMLALLLVLSACTSIMTPPPMMSMAELPPVHEGGAYDSTRPAAPAVSAPPATSGPVSATPSGPPTLEEQAVLAEFRVRLERALQVPNTSLAIWDEVYMAARRAPRQAQAIVEIAREVARRAGVSTTMHPIEQAAATGVASVSAVTTGAAPGPTSTATAPMAGSTGGGGGVRLVREGRDFVMVQVLYATDRKPIMSLDQWRREFPAKGSDYAYFGAEHGELQYGHSTVSIPAKVHQPGQVERPEWYRKENVFYDITLRGLVPLTKEQMTERIAGLANSSPEKDALVVIHGYNVAFNEAVMRTAQIAYDFKFTGAPILYSWPSAGKLQAYADDAKQVVSAEKSLHAFLTDVVLQAGAKKIHLLAHSMGNRLLVNVLMRLQEERPGQAIFDEIVMAAPDVAQKDFDANVAKSIAALARRVSLYVSAHDHALTASHLRSGEARLGEAAGDTYLAAGVDTIDASSLAGNLLDLLKLNHSYYAEAEKVIGDIVALLKSGAAPGAAPRNLPVDNTRSRPFWRFNGAP